MDNPPHPVMVAFRARRTELHLSQTDLSKRVGIGQSRISELEAGTRRPTFATVVRLAAVLQMEIVAQPIERSASS